jgi:excisionase family DNA binding protein
LDAAQVAWSRLAKRWGELASPDSRPDPALAGAASEVRAAIRATSCDATGWATPDQIASRVDPKRALKSLQLSVVGAIDIAHIAREVAATHPTLTAPARVIAMRARGEARKIRSSAGSSAFRSEPNCAAAGTCAGRTPKMSQNHMRRSGAHEPRDLDPKWYTVSQAASLLGYGETKVRMLIISGDLRSLKDGRSRRVLPEWVEDYVRLRASQAKYALD